MAVKAKLALLKELREKNKTVLHEMSMEIDSFKKNLLQNPKPYYDINDLRRLIDQSKALSLRLMEEQGNASANALVMASRGKGTGSVQEVNPADKLTMDELEKIQERINEMVSQYNTIFQSYLEQAIELGVRSRELADLEKELN